MKRAAVAEEKDEEARMQNIIFTINTHVCLLELQQQLELVINFKNLLHMILIKIIYNLFYKASLALQPVQIITK